MGGKALKVTTYRKTTADFLKIQQEISIILDRHGLKYHYVRCYHNKPDHGDLDILLEKRPDIDYRKIIETEFNPQDINSNGDCISFDYDNFQIDSIRVNPLTFDTAIFYYDFDPIGNLSGKIAHKFGLKYGFDGLVYPFRHGSGKLSENIVISHDRRKIMEFLGLDYERYLQEFDNVTDIFDFFIASTHFNKEMFQMDNLTRIDRKRNKKRSSFQAFLKYIDDNNISSKTVFTKEKVDYFQYIQDYFPESDFINKIKNLQGISDSKMLAKSKFNGRMILSLYPDLNSIEIGLYIEGFKKSKGDFIQYCLDTPTDDIISDFKEYVKGA